MAFITRFFAKSRDLRCLLASLILLASLSCNAASLHFTRAEALFADGQIAVSSHTEISLTGPLYDALHHGLPIPFVYEFRLATPGTRLWQRQLGNWLIPTTRLMFQLSHHSLTGAYRLTSGSLMRSFASLSDALAALGTLQGWTPKKIPAGKTANDLAPMLRLRVDHSQFPKHYQMTALGSPLWQLDSGWVDLTPAVRSGAEL